MPGLWKISIIHVKGIHESAKNKTQENKLQIGFVSQGNWGFVSNDYRVLLKESTKITIIRQISVVMKSSDYD